MLSNKVIGLYDGLKSGCEKHFRKFYDLTCGIVYGVCLKFGFSHEDTEEVVQDTYIQFWKQRSSIDTDKNAINLLKIIAKRILYKKMEKKKTALLFTNLSGDINEPDSNQSAQENVKSYLLLHTAIEKLPNIQGVVIKLFYLQGLSVSEIAEYMEVSPRTVENNLYRARKKLAEIFERKNIKITAFMNE